MNVAASRLVDVAAGLHRSNIGRGHAAGRRARRGRRAAARYVARQAAARDVRHALDRAGGAHRRQQRLHVDARRLEQRRRRAVRRRTAQRRRSRARCARRCGARASSRWSAAPLDASAETTSPGAMSVPSMSCVALDDADRRSRRDRTRPSAYMPGISAVSPPISAQPACRQPSAMPAMTASADVDVELAAWRSSRGRTAARRPARATSLTHIATRSMPIVS